MPSPQQIATAQARRYFKNPQDQQRFLRQMAAEANFTDATSPAGAQGYAQIMPATARAWGVQNPHDPSQAYGAAAQHMAQYLKAYGGSWEKALTAYNAGPGAVGRPLPGETRAYISKVLGGNTNATGSGSPGVPAMYQQNANLSIQPTFDKAAYQADQKKFALATLLRSEGQTTKTNSLLSVLPGAPPDASQYTDQVPRVSTSSSLIPGTGIPGSAMDGNPQKGGGIVHVDGKPVAAWIGTALQWAKAHGWTGTVQSGYRSVAEQARIYNSGVRPAAKPGQSNHNFTAFPGGAVDVTNAQQLAQILKRSPYARTLVWAGAKDPVHFSNPHNGSY